MSIEREALEELSKYRWPGNIRELRNVIERLVILSDNKITLQDVKDHL
jgi:transcriptional regulator of acetoin/glycerol metabolism